MSWTIVKKHNNSNKSFSFVGNQSITLFFEMASKKIQGQITRGAISGAIIGVSLIYGSNRTMTTAMYGGLAGAGCSVASDLAVDYILPHLAQPKA